MAAVTKDTELQQNIKEDVRGKIGHKHELKSRTQDIHLDEEVSFAELGLSSVLIKGLSRSGFEKPSPIQLSAIPHGRCGLDLVVQAKSGTGKTCVFAIIALESVDVSIKSPQVLMLAPTREIALQIEEVIRSIGCEMKGLVCHSSIGGLSLKDDKTSVRNAHIVIGTPGRVKQLMELSALNTSSVRLFVLDEADKLLEDSFQEQINWVFSGLPESKQVIAASATYTEEFVQHLCNYMHNPTFIRLNSNDPVLLGVRQYKKEVATGHLPNENYNNKVVALIEILSQSNFQQCLVFSNFMSRAENLSKLMISRGWPTTHIAGSQEQDERIKAITRLKSYDCRILISTDLTSRGIDADRIDLVINLDLPYDCETYLHRVGRAGRFGANGAAITLYTECESKRLHQIADTIGTEICVLPDSLPMDFIQNPKEISGDKRTVQVESFQIMNKNKSPQIPADRNKQKTGQTQTQIDGQQRLKTGDCEQETMEQNHNGDSSSHAADHEPSLEDDIQFPNRGIDSDIPIVETMRNLTINVTDNLTGSVMESLTGKVPGNLAGHVTDKLAGNVTGSLPSNITDNLTGRVTDNPTGHVTDNLTGLVTDNLAGRVTDNPTGHVTDNLAGHVTDNSTDSVNLTGHVTENFTGNASESVDIPLHSESSERIISHRPPFSSLKEAMNFLGNADKYSYLLLTTEYGTVESEPVLSVTKPQGAEPVEKHDETLVITSTNDSASYQKVLDGERVLHESPMKSCARKAEVEPIKHGGNSASSTLSASAFGGARSRSGGSHIARSRDICAQTNNLRTRTKATQTEYQDGSLLEPSYSLGGEYDPYCEAQSDPTSPDSQYYDEAYTYGYKRRDYYGYNRRDNYEYNERDYGYNRGDNYRCHDGYKHYIGEQYTGYTNNGCNGGRERETRYGHCVPSSFNEKLAQTLDVHYRQLQQLDAMYDEVRKVKGGRGR